MLMRNALATCRTVACLLIAVLVGATIGAASPPTARAEVTGLTVVGCEFLGPAIDGDLTDAVSVFDFNHCLGTLTAGDLMALDEALGDDDGKLEPGELDSWSAFDDGNSISASCTAPDVLCTLTVVAFVDAEEPVSLGLTGGVAVPASGSIDALCDSEAEDADCSSDTPGNGDGVVVFSVINGSAAMGDSAAISVTQGGASQSENVTVVGTPASIELELAESTIEPSLSFTLLEDCLVDVGVSDAIAVSNATLATVRIRDASGRSIAREIADLGTGGLVRVASGQPGSVNAGLGLTVLLEPGVTAQQHVLCGREDVRGTGIVSASIDGLSATAAITLYCEDTTGDDDCITGPGDNCPGIPNPDQENRDNTPSSRFESTGDVTIPNGDGLGDVCDDDDDNDGLSDAAETSGCIIPGLDFPQPTGPRSRDFDGDNTLDKAECMLGTDPTSYSTFPSWILPNDSDRDGIPDSVEVLLGSNPASADSDMDRVADGLEFRGWGTVPTSADSDGDGCSDGAEIASVNADHVVNSLDLMLVAASYNDTGREPLDLNRDQRITVIDLQIVARNFAPTPCG